jgi:outer membrane protein assembly factor BamB
LNISLSSQPAHLVPVPAKTNKHLFKLILLAILLLFTTTACVTPRIGVSWPALSLVEFGGNMQILAAYDGQVNMINPENGAPTRLVNNEGEVRVDEQGNPRLWVLNGADAENAQFFASPVMDGDFLLFPAYNERILEVDVLTARAESPVGIALGTQVIADMVVTENRFFVPSSSSGVVALDRETYEILWRFDTDEGVWAKPLLHEGILYFGSIDHNLYAVNSETGTAVWDEPVDLEGAVASTPILVDNHIYVGSFSHKLYKIDLRGNIVASYEGRNWVWSSPVFSDGILYYADLDGFVYALNPATMEEIWTTAVGERGIRPAPLVVDDLVIVAARDGRIYWLDALDGSVVFDREVEGNPEILSNILYVPAEDASADGEALIVVGTTDPGRLLAAYTVDNGRAVWVYGR